MIRALTIGLLAATAASSAVMAADLIVEEPIADVAVAASDWTGPYVGIFGGWATGIGDQDITLDSLGFLDDDGAAIDISGGMLGVTAGVNFQADSVVYGIEGDIAWANISGFTNPDGDPENDGYETSVDWLGTLRGRLGFAADSFLIYGTAGIAAGHVNVINGDVDLGVFDPSTGTAEGDVTSFGYVVGVGAELAVAENISVKAEYNFIDLGETDFTAPTSFGGADEEGSVDVNLHTVKIGLNFSF